MTVSFQKDIQYYKFCAYGFFKNLRFFDAFIILFFLDKGITFLQIGILYSVREITVNILEIPSGVIADSFGRRRSMIFSFSNYIISFLIFFLFSDYYLFIIAYIFYAVGDAFRTGTHKAMIFEYLKIKKMEHFKVHYYGHTRSWSQFGSAISSLIAALIVLYSGNYSSVFLFSVIPYVIDLFLMISYPKELDGSIKNFEIKKIKQTFIDVIKDFAKTIKNLTVFKAITNVSLYTGYYKALKDYIQPLMKSLAIALPFFVALEDKEKSAIIIGVIYFIIYILTSISSRNSGRFSQRFRNLIYPMNYTLLIGLFAGVLTGLFFHFKFLWMAIILFVIIYMIENIRKPIGISCITTLFKKDVLATALSVESQANTLFSAIFAPIIGLLADKVGIGYGLAFLSGFLVLLYPILKVKVKSE